MFVFRAFICSTLLAYAASAGSVVSHESELRKKLLKDYDKTALPSVFSHISIGFTILGMRLEEAAETLHLDTWVKLEWNDPRLSWDASLYPTISRLAFPTQTLWAPDITVYNNARMETLDHVTDPLMLVWPNGKVLTVPTAAIPAMCVFDLTYWPNDVQNCTAKLGSWVFSGYTLNLTGFQGKDSLSFDIGQSKGDTDGKTLTKGHHVVKSSAVTFHTKYYDCCPEPYMSVEINLLLERDAPAYCWLYKVPAVVLGLMTGVLFMFPPGSAEKLTVGTLLLFMDMMFLGCVSKAIKNSPSHTPLIVQYMSEQLIITMLCVLVAALTLRLSRSPHSDSLPRWLHKAVSVLQAPLCVSGYWAAAKNDTGYHLPLKGSNAKDLDDPSGHQSQQSTLELQNTSVPTSNTGWLALAAVIDRFIFILYILVILIRIISYSAIL